TKIQYIRTFDQLKTEVKERMKEMEEDIGEIATLKQEITDLFTKSKNDIDKLSKDTIKELNDTSANNLDEIDGKLNSAKSNIDNSILNYKESVENIRDGFQKFIDENEFITTKDFDDYKIEIKELTESFSSNIQAIKEELQDDISQQIDNKIVDLDWQKYKFTENDGTVMSVPTDTDMNELKAGMYEASGFINDPLDDPGFYEVTVTESYNSRKVIYALHSYSNRMFVKTFHSGGKERNWEELTTNITDTGWVPFQLINGTIANNAFKTEDDNGIDCSYRIITNGSVTEKSVRINAENIAGTQQIAILPEGFAKNVQFHLVRVPIHRGQGLIGIFPSGSVYAYVESDKRDSWRDTDYFYGEIGWKE
ncbi:MAG: hypothetical protein L0I79_06720, partial [Atopostipes sp.]|nr:hypothetical protein [Atopostipes sp.]